jgi:hypothetical protein
MIMLRRKIADYLIWKKSIIRLLENPVDLTELRKRLTKRLIFGWILMAFSYVIGWPAIAGLGVIALWYKEPLIAVIGGPVMYVISCLVFILGAWLARAPQHLGTLIKFATQSFIRKYSTKNFS